MPFRQQAEELLAAWRAAERALSAETEGSPERARIQREIERLRAEYHRLVDRQRDAHGPPLPKEPLGTP